MKVIGEGHGQPVKNSRERGIAAEPVKGFQADSKQIFPTVGPD